MKRILPFLITLVLIISFPAQAQIKGRIIDAETNIPISEALIFTKSLQTISSSLGTFTLDISESDSLSVSHLGYRTVRISVSQLKLSADIYLVPIYTHLEAVSIRTPLMINNYMSLPSSISILHSRDLLNSQGISYMEDLNRLPGVYVHNGTLNTNRVTIRGMGSRTPYGTTRVKAYFNEIPLSSGDGTTSLEDIDPTMIHSVKIIKGSKSAMYGPGLGGTILLAGRSIFQEGLHGHAGFELGSFNTYNPYLNLQLRKGKISGSAIYAYANTKGWRQNSNYKRHSLNLNAKLSLKRNKTDLLFHFLDLNAQIPSSVSEKTFLNAPDSAAQNWLSIRGFEKYQRLITGVKNEFEITNYLSNTTILFFNYYDGFESRPFNILDDESLQGGIISNIDFHSDAWHLKAGIELMAEKYNWSIFETNRGIAGQTLGRYSENRKPFRSYLQTAYTFKNGVLLEASLSYNLLSYRLLDRLPGPSDRSGSYNYTPHLSPFIGANFPLNKQLKVYASIGHGFSYPNVEETLLPDGQANPELKPEQGVNMELGTRLSAWDGRLFSDLNIYLLYVKDLLITERESDAVFYGKNAGKTRHAGVEAITILRLRDESFGVIPGTSMVISITMSEDRFTDFVDEGISHSKNKLPGLPPFRFVAQTTFSYSFGFSAYVSYNYVGRQFLNDANSANYEAYNLLNLKLNYKPEAAKFKPTIYLGIRNLLNEHYASMLLVNAPSFGGKAPRYYYPGQPISFYVGMDVKF